VELCRNKNDRLTSHRSEHAFVKPRSMQLILRQELLLIFKCLLNARISQLDGILFTTFKELTDLIKVCPFNYK
jgi:hypothetical protein